MPRFQVEQRPACLRPDAPAQEGTGEICLLADNERQIGRRRAGPLSRVKKRAVAALRGELVCFRSPFMNQLYRLRIALPLLCLSLLTGRAQATHRADFFDIAQRPGVDFDRGAMTWTLSNQAVSR